MAAQGTTFSLLEHVDGTYRNLYMSTNFIDLNTYTLNKTKQNTEDLFFKRQDLVKVCSLINVSWLSQFIGFDNTRQLCKILPARKLSNRYLGQFRTFFFNLVTIYFGFFERVLLCNSVHQPNWLGIHDNPTWTLGC